MHELLDYVAHAPKNLDGLLANALKTGELNLKAMALLDAANTERLRPPGADGRARRAAEGQGHPGLAATT